MATSLGKTLGKSGTQIYHGIITAEEYNSNLNGKQALRAYDTMLRSDATISSIVQMVTLPLISLDYDVEPASDDKQDVFIADFIKHDLMSRNVNWNAFVEEAMSFLPFGHAVAEKTYELCSYEGKELIGTKSILFLKQTSILKWETKDGEPGVTQLLIGTEDASIPLEKLLIFSHKRRGENYAGTSMLRSCYKDWDMKDKLGLVMAVGLEKQAIPTPVLTVPANAAQNDIDNAEELLRNIRANEEAFLRKPEGWTLEKFDMSGQTTAEILPAIKYYDRQMQMSILAPFMGLGGEGASGSRAVGDVQYKPYLLQLRAIAREFIQSVQEQWIKQLCDLNFSELPNGYPKLTHGELEQDSIVELGDYVTKLASANALTMTLETEQYLRRVGRLPELTEEQEKEYLDEQADGETGEGESTTKPAVTPNDDKTVVEAPTNEPAKAKDIQAAITASKQVRKILVDFLDED